ncbi:MAG: cohesin domain-containing protein [Ruminococcus sp.]|nr:cohesin domain-containing protein [Ruminococcus sp.]MDY4908983.1 cohesin domain-containing protein [Candidatus Fimenecus sp.]
MVKSKKILSLALALVMALGVLTMGVFAAKTTPTATFTVSSSASEVANGDEVTITVKANATETFYAGPMSLPIEYNASLFEYVADSATVANIYGAGTTKSAVKAEAGKLTVALTPSTSGAVTAPDLNGANLTVLTFKLKAIGTTGSSTVAIANDQKTAANIGGKFYCGSFDSANPKTAELTELGQTLNRVDTTISYKGAVGTPELVLTQADNGAVIRKDLCTTSGEFAGCVFGIDTLNGENIEDFVTTAVGSIEVVANADGNISTGATILLKDAAGEVVATYVFIYFGDVNGDGAVDITDAATVEAHDQWVETIEEDTAAYYASDVNYDAVVDITDSAAIEAQDQWVEALEAQNVIAKGFNGAW